MWESFKSRKHTRLMLKIVKLQAEYDELKRITDTSKNVPFRYVDRLVQLQGEIARRVESLKIEYPTE